MEELPSDFFERNADEKLLSSDSDAARLLLYFWGFTELVRCDCAGVAGNAGAFCYWLS